MKKNGGGPNPKKAQEGGEAEPSGKKKEYKYVRLSFRFEGELKSVRGKTKPEAEKKMRELKDKLNQGLKLKGGNVSVTDYILNYMLLYRDCPEVSKPAYDQEMRRFEKYVFPAIGSMRMNRASKDHLQKIVKNASGSSRSFMSKLVGSIKRVFSNACDDRIIPYDPSAKLRIPPSAKDGSRRALTTQERNHFLRVCQTHSAGLWIKSMLLCGLRPGEAAALTWADVDAERGGFLKIRQAVKADKTIGPPKTEAGMREVPIDGSMLHELAERKKSAASPFDRVFKGMHGQNLDGRSQWSDLWKSFQWAVDADMGARQTNNSYGNKVRLSVFPKDISIYNLRHSYGNIPARQRSSRSRHPGGYGPFKLQSDPGCLY
ncbi:MAG: hypothetical protein LBU32_06190 [Clostridiales bacterium]|jgi:integrase|nr:hypothetical protein [Clostridiales bacterium]